ncbi:Fe-S cluster assembly protein SufD [Parvularcula sp. IMCC14364]|uniref:Fe-S cluster assembly protein SufD n=1 Tax=Parvularcula sp. IMCC14364 TaxID=3067902 RepID=UPI002740F144|nr:Fe-S cluster assembly protein SufD [Parvularcula sp. IMCC14364]
MAQQLKHTDSENSLLALLPAGNDAALLRSQGLPGRRTEDWRWSDLRGVLKGPIALSDKFAGSMSAGLPVPDALTFTFANGQLMSSPENVPEQIRYLVGAQREETVSAAMPQLAASLVDQTHTLEITGECAQPVHLRYLSDGTGMHQTRVRIRLSEGARATIVEEFTGGEQAWLANSLSEFSLSEKAVLTRIVLQEAAPAAITVNTALLDLQARSRFHQTTVAFGGRLTRLETQLVQGAPDSQATLNAAYLLNQQNHLDMTTLVHHLAERGVTGELVKGVLADASCGVFQGKFLVARGAQKIDARMAHNALLLSEKAEVNAKPELEIYADDVECAHGNTAGALDDQALFYMRQRGLSEHQARAILVDAFLGEVLDDVEDDALRAQLTERVGAFMEQQS